MRFRTAFAGLLLLSPFAALAQSRVHMHVLVTGAAVGENTYEVAPDGAITSSTTIDLGSIKAGSKVTAHLEKGRLIDATAITDGPGGEAKVIFANGKVEVGRLGKTASSPWVDKDGTLAANLHPQFWAGSLLAAEKAIRANPALKSANVNAYFVDAGVVFPLKITMLSSRAVMVDGKKVDARRFTAEVPGVSIEFALDEAGHVAVEDIPAQKLAFMEDGWDGYFTDPMAKYPELSQATFKTKTEKGVHMKTRDGVDLVCDIVRPDDDLKHPAILSRTPYGRGAEAAGGQFYAIRGYVFVAQDCRGREDSGGEWDPFVHEGPDGYDTIQWVSVQPWCDGKVGMIGGSYGGYVQWAAAVLNPPALKCIIPQVSPPDAMHNLPYDYGVFALYPDIWWAKIVAGRHTDFSSIKSALPHPEKFTTLPLSKVDEAVLGQHLDFFDKWLSRPTIGDWKGWDFTYHMQDANVPALHISGIWDGDEIGTHLNWEAMRNLGRKDQWIVFGPWVHAFNTTHSLGDTEYGTGAIIDLDSMFLRWFDTWLKGKSVGMGALPHAFIFVTGANSWMGLPNWPAKTTPARTLYLTKAGLAAKPGKSASDGYTFDPAKDNVIPRALIEMDETKATTKIATSQLKKGTYLLLKSQPMKTDTAISAPFNVKLYFTTSAKDTDFFVLITDIAPNGEMRMLGQAGKIRGTYLQGMDKVRPLTPGKTYVAQIVPWDFAHEFKKGHRIGLYIVSSMFPMFARNLGTGEPIKNATRMVAQRNKILMGSVHPSSLTFHVLWER